MGIREKLKEEISKRKKKKNLKMTDLEKIINVESRILYQILNGRRGPPRRTFPALAAFLNIPLEQVIELAHEDRKARIKVLR